MDKRMLKITITQLRQIALFAVGMSLLTACGNSQSGMKFGDAEFTDDFLIKQSFLILLGQC